MLVQLLQPLLGALVSQVFANVVHQQGSHRTPVVPVGFMARRTSFRTRSAFNHGVPDGTFPKCAGFISHVRLVKSSLRVFGNEMPIPQYWNGIGQTICPRASGDLLWHLAKLLLNPVMNRAKTSLPQRKIFCTLFFF